MLSAFDFLNVGWVGSLIGLVGVVLALISIGLAIHYYRRSRQGAEISYQTRTRNLLGGRGRALPEPVKILFRDREIEHLVLTIMWIWNSSDKTIYGRNIVESDPLRVDVGTGAIVLDGLVLRRSRHVNNSRISDLQPGSSDVRVNFDYLDSGDGFAVVVYHTDSDQPVSLRGSIHEMPRGFKQRREKPRWWVSVAVVINAVLTTVVGGLFGYFVAAFRRDAQSPASEAGFFDSPAPLFLGAMLIIGVLSLWITYMSLRRQRARYPKSIALR